MSKYQKFIFKSYLFDQTNKSIELNYNYDNSLDFKEIYTFNFDLVDFDTAALDRAIQLLFFVAGVSYYKAYLAPEIIVEAGSIDQFTAQFLNKTYRKGLGEFFYVNQLDPNATIDFPVNSEPITPTDSKPANSLMIGVGGGKDSLVSIEVMRERNIPLSTWSVGHKSQLTPLVNRIDLSHYWVDRLWDRSLLDHNSNGAYNGHIPISAVLACVGAVTAILSGQRDIVVSNEHSANEPTLIYKDFEINHQYSKSQEFEEDYQAILKQYFGDSIRYYSLLRPFSELRISEIFSRIGFDKYHDVFSSCNKAFTHNSDHIFWDGTCSKCAFIFLVLTPFIARTKLEQLFSGKNLLLDPMLDNTYKQLLGIEGDKPLECVGEIRESRKAMRLAQAQYPELSKYEFELPANYDYRLIDRHSMPDDIYQLLMDSID